MKKLIIATSLLFFSLTAVAQNINVLDRQVDIYSLPTDEQGHIKGFYILMFDGAAPLVAISVDNIVGYKNYIPFIDYNVREKMKIKWRGEIDKELNGFFEKGYTEYIYDVDGKLYLTAEDKKALSAIDWRDIDTFTFIPKREAKKLYGEIGRKGAVVIKTKVEKTLDN